MIYIHILRIIFHTINKYQKYFGYLLYLMSNIKKWVQLIDDRHKSKLGLKGDRVIAVEEYYLCTGVAPQGIHQSTITIFNILDIIDDD